MFRDQDTFHKFEIQKMITDVGDKAAVLCVALEQKKEGIGCTDLIILYLYFF